MIRKAINVALLVILFILILGLILAINADVKTNNSNIQVVNTDNSPSPDNPVDKLNINLSPSDVPKLVEALKIWKLIDDIELEKIGEDKMIIFLAKYKQLEKIRFDFHRERGDEIEKLEKILESNGSDQQVKKVLDDIKKIDSNFREKDRQLLDELNSNLTPAQQAKFMLFQDNYWRDMRQMMRNLKELSNLRENKMKQQSDSLSQN